MLFWDSLLIKSTLQAFAAQKADAEKLLRQGALQKTLEESVCMQGWVLIRDTYLPNLTLALMVCFVQELGSARCFVEHVGIGLFYL